MNLKRAHRGLDKIQTGLRDVQPRTLPGDVQSVPCWQGIGTVEPSTTIEPVSGMLALDQHITEAQAFDPNPPYAASRALSTSAGISWFDCAIRVDHVIRLVRCEMEDFQFYTLRGRAIAWVDCWLGPSNHFDAVEAGNTDAGSPTLVISRPATNESQARTRRSIISWPRAWQPRPRTRQPSKG